MKVGDKAPDIRVHTDTGEDFKLSEMKGKRVVLYFYPKADTPGCTVEACEFRDGIKGFAKKGAVVVWISVDGLSQAKFKGSTICPSRCWPMKRKRRPGVRRIPGKEYVRQEGDGDHCAPPSSGRMGRSRRSTTR